MRGTRGVVFGDEKRSGDGPSSSTSSHPSILRSTGAAIMGTSSPATIVGGSPPQSPGQRAPGSSSSGGGGNMSGGNGTGTILASGGAAITEPQPVGGVRARHAPRVTQRWKINDHLAQKNGACQAVYWVRQRTTTAAGAIGHLARRSGEKVDLRDMKVSAGDKKQWVTGTVYKGEWKGNLKHGFGTQIWANGNKYEGEWERGMRHGHGDLWIKRPGQETLERIYTGNWKNDLKDGLGVFSYSDGSRYEGNWKTGLRHGQGTLYYPNGNEYVGEWQDGWQNGYGRLTYQNEDVYEGDWLNGKREGPGIFYYKSKEKIYDGEWVNDIAKCGVYTDAKEFFDNNNNGGNGQPRFTGDSSIGPTLGTGADRLKRPLPVLRLADPDALLVERIETIQKQRQAVRNMPFMPLEGLFDEAAIDDLRRIFASADSEGNGQMPVSSLRDVLAELQFTINDEELAQVLLDLRKKPSGTLNFSEFVKAAHLVDDMKSNVGTATDGSSLVLPIGGIPGSLLSQHHAMRSSSIGVGTPTIGTTANSTSSGTNTGNGNGNGGNGTDEDEQEDGEEEGDGSPLAASSPMSATVGISISSPTNDGAGLPLHASDLANASSPLPRSPMPDRPAHPTPAAAMAGSSNTSASFSSDVVTSTSTSSSSTSASTTAARSANSSSSGSLASHAATST